MNKLLALMLGFTLLFSLVGCAASPPAYDAYRATAFRAEVEVREGEGEKSLRALIEVHPTATGTSVRVEYLSPEPLAGLQLSAVCNEGGEAAGEVLLWYAGSESRHTATQVQGLLRPATVWLIDQTHERVEHDATGYRLSFSNGEYLLLDPDGIPRAACQDGAEFWIIWWETVENTAE